MDDETFLNERIEVAAVFDNSLHTCRPLRFKRKNGRVVEITKIGLRHPTKAGHRTVHVYDVTDGNSEYRLELDSERLAWHLTREAMYE